jgi:predicted ribosomally synthesized peptide with nif11-like leader
MAIIAVKHFLDKVYSDQELMSTLERHRDKPFEVKLDMSLSKARELGYDFTSEEFREVDQIKSFWRKMDTDGALREKVASAQAKTPEQTAANIVRLAESEGFKFSQENLVTLSEIQMKEKTDGELTEADLEAAAGGTVPRKAYDTTMCPW